MKLTYMMTAVAASALFTGAAMAQGANNSTQSQSTGSTSMPSGPVNGASSPDSTMSTPSTASTTAMSDSSSAPAAGNYATGASYTLDIITNGPIPDTPENRAKYGAPLSNAGKRTAANGN